MSMHPPAKPLPQPHPQYAVRPPEPDNPLAIAGLVLGVCSLVMCAGFAPFGLVISLMAMRRPGHQGLSIAGAILSSISCLLLAAVFAYVVVVFGVVAAVIGASATLAVPYAATHAKMAEARSVIKREDPLPGMEEGERLLEARNLRDGWDRPFRYEPSGRDFVLTSAGPDGRFDTEDDVRSDDLLD